MPERRHPPEGDDRRRPLPGTRRAKLLIVDDEDMNVLLLEDMLRQAGYSAIRSTTDSRETLALARAFSPDLILLDLMMPGMDGIAVMKQLKAEWPGGADVPVLVLTADISPQSKRRALLKGAKDFLTKPLDSIELFLRIENLLETRFLFLDLQRTSEKRLQLALDSGRLGTYHRDVATGEYLNISDTGKVHCGYPPDAELSYADAVRAQHPDDRAGVEAAMRQAQADGSDFEVEYRVIAPDGGVQWIVSHGMPICDAWGKVIQVFVMTQDITERKRAQEALRASAEKLQALSRRLVDVQEAERRGIARELHD